MEMNLVVKAKDIFPSHAVQQKYGVLVLLKSYTGSQGEHIPVRFTDDSAFVFGVGEGFSKVVWVDLLQETLDLFERYGQVKEKKVVWIDDGALIKTDRNLTDLFTEQVIVEIMEDFFNHFYMEV